MDTPTLILQAVVVTLSLLIPPLADGIERKVRAKIQFRVGPPTILQTFYDLRKLTVKELIVPKGAELTLTISSIALVTAVAATASTIWMVAQDVFTPANLALTVLLISGSHVLISLTSLTTSNPYAIVGSFRKILLQVVNEVGFFVGVLYSITALKNLANDTSPQLITSYVISVALIVITTYVSSGRIPYDIHEAEPELASGVLIELSGPLLSIYSYTHILKKYLLSFITAYLILTPFTSLTNPAIKLAANLTFGLMIYLSYGFTAALLGRTRIDLSLKTLTTITLIIIFLLVILSWLSSY